MLTLAKQQPTRNDFLQGTQGKDTGSRNSPVVSPRIAQITDPNNVRLPKMTDPSIARIPKCARCRNHGIDCELKGHKEKCQFKNCACRSCLVVVERQKVTATRVAHLRHQRKLAVKRGSDTPDYRNRNPLTEEEELILSRHLQNKTADDTEYKRYNQTKNNDRYERYSDVIPPFSNTKACMLLREAQNAYSYFYGKCYYPDEKDERYTDQMLSLNTGKHYDGKYYRDIDSNSPTYSKTFKTVCVRETDEYATEKYSKCTNRAIIAPRVVRLDENQYYREYFKSDKRDYYYEQKVPQRNTPPPISKYERMHVNMPTNNRSVEPLKVNNALEKEIPQNREELSSSHNIGKRLEVLMVMFPEIKEERLKEVLRQHNSDIQSTVQFLLKIKNSPSDVSIMQSCRSSNYASPHNTNTVSDSYQQNEHSEHGIHIKQEKKPNKQANAQDAQELSAFTAVRRKCAR